MLDKIKKSVLSTRILKPLVVFYVHYITSRFVVSYPKCGRTWVKVMLAKALALHFGDSQEDVISPIRVIKKGRYPGPIIRFLHLGTDVPPNPQEKKNERQYSRYRDKKVVLLVRDPRDVLVSYYFHRTRRIGEEHELASFIRHPWWGIDRLIAFMNGWYENRDVPLDFFLLRYEDLHRDPTHQLRQLLSFMDLQAVSDVVVKQSVEYANFDNMRKLALSSEMRGSKIAPTNPRDPESFKVRKGEVGGFGRYLSAADALYLEKRIRRELPAFFGYPLKETVT